MVVSRPTWAAGNHRRHPELRALFVRLALEELGSADDVAYLLLRSAMALERHGEQERARQALQRARELALERGAFSILLTGSGSWRRLSRTWPWPGSWRAARRRAHFGSSGGG